jgi:M6 family metalloprotease-like protein
LAAVPVFAQVRAEPGRFEIQGLDFRADGAWRRGTRTVQARRHRLLAAREFSLLNARIEGARTGPSVTGAYTVPVIALRYSNISPTSVRPLADYANLLFSPSPSDRPYSLKTFYEQLSNGLITMGGTVFGWVSLDSTDLYYEDGCNGIGAMTACPHGYERFGRMLIEGLDAVSSGPDSVTVWAAFDNDGPDGLPNSGDDDGVVDFVTFLQPEVDGACGTSNIWADRWVVSGVNNGSPYVTKTPSNAPGHSWIIVDDYTMQSAVGGLTACDASQIMPIGTVAHETGHAFGLPDLYDTQLVTQGIGEWGLMGSGNYARPYSPSRMEAWSLAELGWITLDTLRASGPIELGPVTSTDTVLVLSSPVAGEYFLIENRQAEESDTAMLNPTFDRAKAPGLLVWHIDPARINTGLFSTTVNTGAVHGVALFQADGLNQLRTPYGGNRGDTGDSYPGSSLNDRLDAWTNPALRTHGDLVVAGVLDSITQQPSGAIRFRFTLDARLQVTLLGDGEGVVSSTVQGNLAGGILVPPGSSVTLTAMPADGSTFGGWSGDTTAAEATLTLGMDRSYVLVATFHGVATFTVEAAAEELLGVPSLTASQTAFLDGAGNHNGSYDLGDFLAYLDRTGQAAQRVLLERSSPSPRGR